MFFVQKTTFVLLLPKSTQTLTPINALPGVIFLCMKKWVHFLWECSLHSVLSPKKTVIPRYIIIFSLTHLRFYFVKTVWNFCFRFFNAKFKWKPKFSKKFTQSGRLVWVTRPKIGLDSSTYSEDLKLITKCFSLFQTFYLWNILLHYSFMSALSC